MPIELDPKSLLSVSHDSPLSSPFAMCPSSSKSAHENAPIFLSPPHMTGDEQLFIDEAFRTNWIAPLGPNVDAFEREFGETLGALPCCATSSGTAAIHLGLSLLGVGAGDLVLCTSFTFVASANPIRLLGAEPVFVDSEPESWNMSPSALRRALEMLASTGKKPKAVLVVNLYGQSADYGSIRPICDEWDVPILEDAAESLGATYLGHASGTFGDVAAFSFNGNKIITTSGGGMLAATSSQQISRARFLATQAREPAAHYEHREAGFNYRMSNVLAGIGRAQLRALGSRVAARREIFARYQTALAAIPGVHFMPEPAWSHSTRWLTALTIDPKKADVSRDDVLRALAAEKIEARPTWKPMHLQPLFANCQFFPHECGGFTRDISARLFAEGICLPSGSSMTEAQQDRVITAITNVFAPQNAPR